ncbi:MAG: hypothetical protein ACM3VZ_02445 [Acidobacteriota bacterium]
MKIRRLLSWSAASAAWVFSAAVAAPTTPAAPEAASSAAAAEADVDLDTVTLIMPVQISRQALSSGCWIQLFDQVGFKGRALTVLGPSEFKALAKAIGMQSKQSEPDSVVVGPKATVTLYEGQNFQGKSGQFQAGIREPELHKKLGFAGRIESMKIDCPKATPDRP